MNTKRHAMTSGNSYIVRIYRCVAKTPHGKRSYDAVQLVGTVESTLNGQSVSFHTIDDLWAALIDRSFLNDNT